MLSVKDYFTLLIVGRLQTLKKSFYSSTKKSLSLLLSKNDRWMDGWINGQMDREIYREIDRDTFVKSGCVTKPNIYL